MAISFISNALGATTSTTSFSVALPTTQAGDIIILEFVHRGTGDGTIGGTSVTTGGLTYTLKHDQPFATSTFSGKTYWARATGDHAGQTVTGTGLTNSCAAIVTIYRGALASGDPLADATIVGEQNDSGDETQAQITTATDGAWVVLVVANSPDVAISAQACTSPGVLAERAERLSTGGTDSSIAHASAEMATAGATGAFTWAQTNGASGSWAYAIEPEPEATGTEHVQGVDGALSFVGAATRRTSHRQAGGVTFVGAARRSSSRRVAGGLSSSGSVRRAAARALSGALAFAGSVASTRLVQQALTAAVSFAGSLASTRAANVFLAASLALSGAARRATVRPLAGMLNILGAIRRNAQIFRQSALSPAGTILRIVRVRATSALALAASLPRRAARGLQAGLAHAGSLAGQIAVDLPELFQVSLSATVGFYTYWGWTLQRSLSAALSPVGRLLRHARIGATEVLRAAVRRRGTTWSK